MIVVGLVVSKLGSYKQKQFFADKQPQGKGAEIVCHLNATFSWDCYLVITCLYLFGLKPKVLFDTMGKYCLVPF